MKLPCAKQIPFIVYGLSFLQTALTNIQYENLTLIATALILGSRFNLTEISCMWRNNSLPLSKKARFKQLEAEPIPYALALLPWLYNPTDQCFSNDMFQLLVHMI